MRKVLKAIQLNKSLIEKMDLDHSGSVSEGEFLAFMLVQERLVTQVSWLSQAVCIELAC